MAAEAILGTPSGSAAPVEPPTTTTMVVDQETSKSASKSSQKRPQTTVTASRTAHPTEIPAATKPAKGKGGETPQRAGERQSSHLDMLAETVRAIVTQVMQPETVLPGDCANDVEEEDLDGDQLHGMTQEAETVEVAVSRSEYSVETRQLCVDKHAAGQSYKAIAEELKMPVTTVQTIVKRAKQQGGAVATAARAGRPRVTNEGVEATIRELVAQNPGWTAREVLDQVLASHEGIAVSFETIRRRVRDCKKKLCTESGGAALEMAVPLTGQAEQGKEDEGEEGEEGEEGGMCEDTVDPSADSHELEDDGEESGEAAETTSTEEAAPTETVVQPVGTGKGKGKARRKRGSEYTPEVRELCLVKHERDGKSYHAIAEELNIPPDSVRAIVRKAKKTGTVESAPRSGRPRKTTDLIDRVILQSVKNSERSTAKQIQDDLMTIYQVKVSVETIRRRVRDHTKQRLQLVDTTVAQAAPIAGPATSGEVDADANTGSKRSKRPSATTPTAVEEVDGSVATGEQSKKRKRAEYSVETRERCVELHRQGLGYRKIGDQLGMPHTTVRAIVEKVLRTGSALPAPRSGRPRKTDEILDKVILQTVKMNSKCSARMIQQELESGFDVKVSCETIRRRVKDYMRQKHLFADFVESSTGVTSADAAVATNGAVEDQVARTVTDFQLQQSMFGLASSDLHEQHIAPVQHSSVSDSSLRGVPQSLMEMMTAAAAAAAVVTSHQQHQAAQQQQQAHQQLQQPLALLPMTFMNNPHAFSLHSHTMQTMRLQAMDTTNASTVSSQPPQPLSPMPLNDFVL